MNKFNMNKSIFNKSLAFGVLTLAFTQVTPPLARAEYGVFPFFDSSYYPTFFIGGGSFTMSTFGVDRQVWTQVPYEAGRYVTEGIDGPNLRAIREDLRRQIAKGLRSRSIDESTVPEMKDDAIGNDLLNQTIFLGFQHTDSEASL